MFELLAAVQALAIYMIVRIDEGETEQNDIDELLVRTTVVRLSIGGGALALTDPQILSHALGRISEGLTPGETDETEWKSWIYQETHRR